MPQVSGAARRSAQQADCVSCRLRKYSPTKSGMKRTSTLYFVALVISLPLTGGAQEKQRFATLEEALQSSAILRGRQGPRNVNWIEGGRRYSYIDRDQATGAPVIRAYDPAAGRDTLLFATAGKTFPGTSQAFSYDSFQWAQDSKHLVFQTNFQPLFRRSGISDFYIYSLSDGGLQLATKGARTGELSPNGAMLGFERGGDMYVTTLANHQEKRLTRDATEHVFNGHFDWVYEEEFGLAQAWSWSPDSRHLAYWQVDESKEPEIQLTDYSGRHPEWDRIRIPQPGDSNPTVRIGVADVTSGRKIWLDP